MHLFSFNLIENMNILLLIFEGKVQKSGDIRRVLSQISAAKKSERGVYPLILFNTRHQIFSKIVQLTKQIGHFQILQVKMSGATFSNI